jgi:hypothetical protein
MATLTMEVPEGTIDPITGHINADDAALYRAIGPDQADPPSTPGRRSEQPRIPFGWVRPPTGGPPGGFPGGGFPRRGGPPGGVPGGGGFPGGGVSRICRDPPQNARRKKSFGTSRRAHSNTHVTGSHVTTYG